jgi:NAD-dependent DNA ligase
MNTLIALSPGLLMLAVMLPCFIAGGIGRRRAAERERAAAEARAAAKRRAEETKRAAVLEKKREAARKAEEKAAKQQAKPKKSAQKKPKQAERAPIIPAEINAAQPFAGEAVAFTGTCPKMERRFMIARTERLGGKGYETINTRCTLLVIGEHPGRNQQERAAKWHIPTVTWQEWYRRAFGPDSLPQPKPADLSKFLTPSQFADQYAA